MPSSSATAQACWPAAPPKQHSVYFVTSWPFCTEMRLMAFAMLATATRMKPSATATGSGRLPVARAIWSHSAENFALTTPASSGWSPCGPNTAGKKAGCTLPVMTLASVMASGPPRR